MFYPEAIHPSDTPAPQAENTPSTANPHVEVLLPSLPPPEASSNKTAAVSEVGVASTGFQQDLASTVLPAKGDTKDKEEVTTMEADKPANQAPKIQIKLKKYNLLCNTTRNFV